MVVTGRKSIIHKGLRSVRRVVQCSSEWQTDCYLLFWRFMLTVMFLFCCAVGFADGMNKIS